MRRRPLRGTFQPLIFMMLMNITDNYSYLRATVGKKENILIRVIYHQISGGLD